MLNGEVQDDSTTLEDDTARPLLPPEPDDTIIQIDAHRSSHHNPTSSPPDQQTTDNLSDEPLYNTVGAEASSLLAMRNEIGQPMSIAVYKNSTNLVAILYLLCISVSLLSAVLVDWRSYCEQPLKQWVIAQIILHGAMAIVQAVLIYRLPDASLPDDVRRAHVRSLAPVFMFSRSLNLMWFIWFLVGAVWTFQAYAAGQCASSAPFLFRMCFTITIIQILIICGILLLCCCACVVLVLRVAVVTPAEPPALRGATDAMIRVLPAKRYRTGVIPKDDASCAICLDDYEEGMAIRFLPCRHHFHRDCVDKWLVTNKSCPFCKRNIDEPPPPANANTTATATDTDTNPSDTIPTLSTLPISSTTTTSPSLTTLEEDSPLPSPTSHHDRDDPSLAADNSGSEEETPLERKRGRTRPVLEDDDNV
eukprot:TRINITY_DN6201_c0_g1_i5.p1 TRINITY_DN6201_c0_g1~~TRINITY_DN6201_c0_g1_i5.p1  ORF type:complete len:420 (+),score=75.91 TRINITY_DN6201_c0_g1_i5:85-1344(+)